jgi:hypothetical protein
MIDFDQIPREVPHPDNNTPLDVTNPFELIVYIIIPIAMIVFYFFLRKKGKASRKNDEENNQ